MSAALAILPMIWACEQQPRLVSAAPKLKPMAKAAIEPRLAFYRKYTEGMLRRYLRSAMEAGRVPSVLGQEMFRSRASSYTLRNFEDVVIFVHDMEKCLGKLDRTHQLLIARIALQSYTHDETAEMLGMNRRTVVREYQEAVDSLTSILLKAKMLEPHLTCQEGGD